MTLDKIAKIGCMLLILAAIVTTVTAQAANLKIDVYVKPVVSPGDSEFFWYNITSTESTAVTYAPSVSCPDAPVAEIQYLQAEVTPSKPIRDTYRSFSVSPALEPQTCEAKVEILTPVHLIENRTFRINTLPSLAVEIETCKDAECKMSNSVFLEGESVYINYSQLPSGSIVSMFLRLPDSSEQQLQIGSPTKLTQNGTYVVRLTASKEGYKPATARLEFAVIESAAHIESESVCNSDGLCRGNETVQNCPQDCKPALISRIFKNPIYVITISFFIGLIAVLLIYVFLKVRRRHNTL